MNLISDYIFAGGPTGPAVVIGLILILSGSLYFWAAKRHFLRPDATDANEGPNKELRKMKLIVQLAGAFYWLHLFLILRTQQSGTFRFVVAVVIGLAALILFASAVRATRQNGLFLAFATRVPVGIVDTGAYRLTRHPFYVAYTLTFLMGCCFSLSIAAFASTAIMIVIYRFAAIDEEKRLLKSSLATDYEAYSMRMRRFGRWPGRSS